MGGQPYTLTSPNVAQHSGRVEGVFFCGDIHYHEMNKIKFLLSSLHPMDIKAQPPLLHGAFIKDF